ncbi:MAG: hypothetical protein JNN30_12510 [Rhodanobacteraceae bacterium]|nr:hypothetical protein [Rhodanobacteraceae bacterium]
MSTLDLDQLRSRWSAQGRELDAQLSLDLDAVRRLQSARTRSALGRHRRGLLLQLLMGAAGIGLLALFVLRHGGEWPYLLAALPLLSLLVVHFIVDASQWHVIARIDYSAPVMALREVLDTLLRRRLRLVRGVVYISPLVWWLMVMVIVKGLWNIDLLDWMHPSVLPITALAGVALIAIIELASHAIARRFPGAPALRRFLDDLAGPTFRRASEQVENRLRFEREVSEHGAQRALRSGSQRLGERLEAARAGLQQRVSLGLWLITVPILLSGGFNAAHGGQASALLPGVLLHLCATVWLIAGVLHRVALGRLPSHGGNVQGWSEHLSSVVRARRVLLQVYVIASPLLAVALLQVFGLALAGADLWQSLGLAWWLGLSAVVAIAITLLFLRWRRRREAFASAVVEMLSLATLERSADLAQAAVASGDEASDEVPRTRDAA